jgi:hypothetical protein
MHAVSIITAPPPPSHEDALLHLSRVSRAHDDHLTPPQADVNAGGADTTPMVLHGMCNRL